MLATALALDLSPPRPHEWLTLDVGWWQELQDARNAYEQGRREVGAEAKASAEHQKWARSMFGEE